MKNKLSPKAKHNKFMKRLALFYIFANLFNAWQKKTTAWVLTACLYSQSEYSVLNIHWKDWWWSWNSNTLATWCEELTHLKRPWCWEKLKVGGEGDDRGWDGWMASPTQWTWVWVNSRSWWWTRRPGVLQFMGLKRVRHDWATELKWTANLLGYAV